MNTLNFLVVLFACCSLYIKAFMIYIVISGILAKQFLSPFINLKEVYNSSAHLINILYMEITFWIVARYSLS